jgi:LL-diaminopimelate aminotransferase
MPLLPEHDYLPDLQAIPPATVRQAKLMWLNYPNNPTAAVCSLDFFAEAVAFARKNNLIVCHDAAYTQVTFNGSNAPSILQVGAKDVAVEFNTLSKSHNMAGWRVGAALGNEQALLALYRLKTNADSSHFLPILDAATEAMVGEQGWLHKRNHIYSERRDLVVKTLHGLGVDVGVPQASLYVWCPIPKGWTSEEFCAILLDKANISLTPGIVFGKYGEGYVRISITATTQRIAEAMQRLVASELLVKNGMQK